MEGNLCIIVSKIYVHFTRTYQGASTLTQRLKFTQVNHCNWMKKICSSRYHNDNIFKNIHGHQMKSQWKEVLNICSCIYAFLMKKTMLTFCYKFFYYALNQRFYFLWQKLYYFSNWIFSIEATTTTFRSISKAWPSPL